MDDDFNATMVASLKERVAKVEETVKVIAVGMDTMPEEGDFDGLRHAMDCLYRQDPCPTTSSTSSTCSQDLALPRGRECQRGDRVGLQDRRQLQESFAGAKKKAPAMKKNLRPLIEAQGARIQGEIREFETKVEEHKKAFEQESIFQYETGCDAAYVQMDDARRSMRH